MRLAASHIAWPPAEEAVALGLLRERGFSGLEVAPVRVAGPEPYDKPAEAAVYAGGVFDGYGLRVCSLQSLWFGQAGSMFGAERDFLLALTMGAVRFAHACGAGNLVFGSPKNRVLPEGVSPDEALPFFRVLAEAAFEKGTCLALEANAPEYGTNFMTHTEDTLAMARRVDRPGCRVNFDMGTLLLNGESPALLRGHVAEVNHVHISEPNLAPIQRREEHRVLAAILREEGYAGYVSIEMKDAGREALEAALDWVAEVFA